MNTLRQNMKDNSHYELLRSFKNVWLWPLIPWSYRQSETFVLFNKPDAIICLYMNTLCQKMKNEYALQAIKVIMV